MSMTAQFGTAATVPFDGGKAIVAVNDSGTVVAVSQSASSIDYVVGTINLAAQTVSFSAASSIAYSWDGAAPSCIDVAMYGNNVVLVFQIGGGQDELHYRTGTLNGSSIVWNPAVQYDKGQNPSVTINGSTVIEIHNSQNRADKLYYHKGILQGGTISNFDQGGSGFAGSAAEIAYTSCVSSDNGWLVATANGAFDTLGSTYYYSAPSSTCDVVANNFVASGMATSLAWYSWGVLLEVHNANPEAFDGSNIFLAIGTIDGNSANKTYGEITWQTPNQDTKIAGQWPYIAAAGDYAIMTYITTGDTHTTKAVCISQG